ncbi:hypothetical protein [Actinomadura sp. CNU-125]|uniref:hypothetical protein n=1 Tax=Actinomadura sp. CNU-125 TaxID=1904961 RepID=UPI0013014CB6|nr:hypothetical protein [Actinomadura sp. CNU-125]
MRAIRVTPRAVAVEGAIVLSLGAALAAVSLGLLVHGYGGALRLGAGDAAAAGAAGLAAAAVVRLNVRLHRAWKRALGRFTAAAALYALSRRRRRPRRHDPGRLPRRAVRHGPVRDP